MKQLDSFLIKLRSWLLRAAELMALLLVVLVLVSLLLGEASGDYWRGPHRGCRGLSAPVKARQLMTGRSQTGHRPAVGIVSP